MLGQYASQLHQKSQKVRLHGESDAHKDAEYLQAAVNIMKQQVHISTSG